MLLLYTGYVCIYEWCNIMLCNFSIFSGTCTKNTNCCMMRAGLWITLIFKKIMDIEVGNWSNYYAHECFSNCDRICENLP